MNIAIVVNGRAHHSGVTTYINTIVDPLRDLGHQVDVISLFGRTHYRPINVEATRSSDKLLKGNGWMTGAAYVVSKFILFWHLVINHRKRRYDVIYAIDISAVLVARWLKLFTDIKILERVGASIPLDMVAQAKVPEGHPVLDYLRSEESRAFRISDYIIPNSSWSKTYVRGVSPMAKLGEVMISPVDLTRFGPATKEKALLREKYKIPEEEWVIFFPSRLDARKGPRTAIAALQSLRQETGKGFLVCVGRGREEDTIRKEVEEKKLGAHVHLLGMVGRDAMSDIYRMADVVIIPSIPVAGYPEPLANCILESLASGTAVVASDLGGLRDVVRPGITGLLVKPGCGNELAAAIQQLIEDPELKSKIELEGMKYVRQVCAPEKVSMELAEIMNRIRKD